MIQFRSKNNKIVQNEKALKNFSKFASRDPIRCLKEMRTNFHIEEMKYLLRESCENEGQRAFMNHILTPTSSYSQLVVEKRLLKGGMMIISCNSSEQEQE